MAFVPLNTNNSNLANYNSVNSLMLDYQGFKKAVGTSSAEGWVSGVLPSVSSVSYSGNRSYDITFAGPVDTYLSPGMRLKTVRQVAAPTQCTSLNGTNQYWSKSSPTGISFTDDFTLSAWVKLSSYALGIIVAKNTATNGFQLYINASGQITIAGLSGGSFDSWNSYQSIPLNKWVHVVATLDCSGNASTMYIDGISVPNYQTSNSVSSITQAGDLYVGRDVTGYYFPGKIAQVSIHNAILSQAQVRAMLSQTIDSSTTSIISGYTFNGNGNDVTATGNNLTAQNSATATNADSPFSVNSLGTATGTDDYGIVQKVSSTVATVQIPEGNTIPTSGGITSAYISTQKAPYNMPISFDRWVLESNQRVAANQASPTGGVWYNVGKHNLTVPIGFWDLGAIGSIGIDRGAAGDVRQYLRLASSSPSTSIDPGLSAWSGSASVLTGINTPFSLRKAISLGSATAYTTYQNCVGSSVANLYYESNQSGCLIYAIPSLL